MNLTFRSQMTKHFAYLSNIKSATTAKILIKLEPMEVFGWPEIGSVPIFLWVCDKRTSGLVFCAQRFFLWEEFSFTFPKPSAKIIILLMQRTANARRRSPIMNRESDASQIARAVAMFRFSRPNFSGRGPFSARSADFAGCQVVGPHCTVGFPGEIPLGLPSPTAC